MELYRLSTARDPLFAEAFALYETAFPEHERRTRAMQEALMPDTRYHFDVTKEGGAFAGIMLYWENARYTYIEHFAIHQSMRGNALGSKTLAAFCAGRPLVILEIDPPVDSVSIRRELFYGRLGFLKNDYPHAHPPYRGQFPPHELRVMSYPCLLTEDMYRVFRRDLDETVMKDCPA